MHLGEQLVQEALITQAQLDSALKAQLQFGGRIGSNLIELGFVDPDTLARALSRKLGVPPALQKHFASVEPHVIGLFSAKFAERYKAIPLGLTVSTPHRLVVAFMDPVPANLDEVAFGVGRRVEPGVAPELLIVHALEKFYGVKRESRYIRADFTSDASKLPQVVAQAPPPPASAGGARQQSSPGLAPPYVGHSAAAVQAAVNVGSGKKQASDDDELLPPPWLAPTSETHRVAAPVEPQHVAPAAIALGPEPSRPAAPAAPHEIQLAVARNGAYAPDGTARMPMESTPEDAAGRAGAAVSEEYDPNIPMLEPYESNRPGPPSVRPALSCKDAIAAMLKAETKDDIGDTICDYLRSAFGCGLVLILKDGMALGWKGFASDVDESVVESIAIPMSGPSMLKIAVEGRAAFKGAPPSDGAALQSRLWKLLRCGAPKEVIVAPITMGKRVVNLVYAHGFGGSAVSATAVADLASVCESAAAGYARLIRTGR